MGVFDLFDPPNLWRIYGKSGGNTPKMGFSREYAFDFYEPLQQIQENDENEGNLKKKLVSAASMDVSLKRSPGLVV